MKVFILITLFALVLAQPRERPVSGGNLDYTHEEYYTPANTKDILISPEVPSYICGSPGVHADVENNCQIFHMCDERALDPSNPEEKTMFQYTFVCANNTRFDQSFGVCVPEKDAMDCESSPAFYFLNERVGTADPIHYIKDLLAAEEVRPTARGNKLSEQLNRDREYGNYGSYPSWNILQD